MAKKFNIFCLKIRLTSLIESFNTIKLYYLLGIMLSINDGR